MNPCLVHDWLVSSVGGSEKVLEEMHRLFPAPIHTLVHSPKKLIGTYFELTEVRASWIQKLPKAEIKYRTYLPFFPMAIEQFDLAQYDLILSSSHCVAKGVLTHPEQLHICYCHTPVRYAWDLMHPYLREAGLDKGIKGFLAQRILHYIRSWDVHSVPRVDHFIANSRYVAARIQKFYGKKADVIYPPVDLAFFEMEEKKESFYVTASRFIPYKKIGLIVEAFSQMPDKKLIVIGDGPDWEKVKKSASQNVEMLGYQSNESLKRYLQKAKAFVFAAVEDFGILPVEAMASGTPVIAFGKGAVRETVVEGKTGLFFHEQSPEAIRDAVLRFEQKEWDAKACRVQAENFSKERFQRQYRDYVLTKYAEFKQ